MSYLYLNVPLDLYKAIPKMMVMMAMMVKSTATATIPADKLGDS